MEDNKIQYNLNFHNYALAYIDLLGSTKRINNEADTSLNQIKSAISIAKAFEKVESKPAFLEEIRIKAFSDNIIFAIPITEKRNEFNSLLGIISTISIFQEELIVKCKWLLRGAITIGKLYIDDDFVWGEGLVRAYELENKIALNPRVIIDPKIVKQLDSPMNKIEKEVFENWEITLDYDDIYYVDFSKTNHSAFEKKELYLTLDNIYLNSLLYENDERIHQKVVWVSKFAQRLKDNFNDEKVLNQGSIENE